jgi:hypothetical protein
MNADVVASSEQSGRQLMAKTDMTVGRGGRDNACEYEDWHADGSWFWPVAAGDGDVGMEWH